jgi:serine phosphatase RsbU (regulator of sigma subunit)
LPESTYDELTFDLTAGDLFVFCTDGVFEANDAIGAEFGADRLLDVVRAESPQQPLAKWSMQSSRRADFRGDTPPNDDMTAVALEDHDMRRRGV